MAQHSNFFHERHLAVEMVHFEPQIYISYLLKWYQLKNNNENNCNRLEINKNANYAGDFLNFDLYFSYLKRINLE